MPKRYFVCHSCAERVDFSPEERPCEVLGGWLMVSQWKGPGAVEHYDFCSFTCLRSWLDAEAPQVPEVFLKAFEERKDS